MKKFTEWFMFLSTIAVELRIRNPLEMGSSSMKYIEIRNALLGIINTTKPIEAETTRTVGFLWIMKICSLYQTNSDCTTTNLNTICPETAKHEMSNFNKGLCIELLAFSYTHFAQVCAVPRPLLLRVIIILPRLVAATLSRPMISRLMARMIVAGAKK